MKSLTIHGIDDQLEQLIQKKAEISGLSLNKTIKQLLRSALGIDNSGKEKKRVQLMELFGTWTKRQGEEFDKNIIDFEKVNKADWK
jgi:hypothetical protein